MKEKVESKFTPAYMAATFVKPEAVQKFFDGLSYDFARYKSKDYNVFARDGQEGNAYSQNMADKLRFEKHLAVFRDAFPRLEPDSKEWKDMKSQITSMELKLEKVEEELKKDTPPELAREVMQTSQNQSTLESIHLMVDHIGAWFEEGHVGPGTVEFQGKKFTAN